MGGEQITGDGGLLTVSTENAEYLLHPGSHTRATQIGDGTIRGIDGCVLESGMARYEDLCLDELRKNQQYSSILPETMRQEKDIFFVDVPYTCSDARLFLGEAGAKLGLPFLAGVAGMMHAHVGFGLLTIPTIAFCAGGRNRSELPNYVASYAQLSNAYNSFGFRSAVAAEKMERFVAPRLATGREKPTVLVDYGAGHLDIAAYLRHPRVRKAVIRWGTRTLRRAVDMEHVRRVCEYRTGTDGYEKVLHEASF